MGGKRGTGSGGGAQGGANGLDVFDAHSVHPEFSFRAPNAGRSHPSHVASILRSGQDEILRVRKIQGQEQKARKKTTQSVSYLNSKGLGTGPKRVTGRRAETEPVRRAFAVCQDGRFGSSSEKRCEETGCGGGVTYVVTWDLGFSEINQACFDDGVIQSVE